MPRLLVVLALAIASLAAAPAASPTTLTRVLRDFDFEERDRGNVEDLPDGWLKVEGPGLPHYVRGRFDDTTRARGKASFRIDLNGGSAIYRYPAGRIAATPGAVYRVSARVRTTPLAAARARLTAYVVDVDGHVLRESMHVATAAPTADESFQSLSFDLAAGDGAASLVLEIGLLQPALLDADSTRGPATRLATEDIRGTAWFDDVRVAQVPQVTLATDEPTNVFYENEPVTLHVRVRDPLVSDLTTELRIADADGRPAFQRTGGLALVGSRHGNDVRGSVALPPLEPGWYEATLALRADGQTVGEHAIRFVRLVGGRDAASRVPDPRLGFDATRLPAQAWPLLPDVSDRLAAGRLKLAVWSDRDAADDSASPQFDRVIDKLRRRDVAITACLASPPPSMQNSGARWQDLLTTPPERWEPEVADLVARLGTSLTTWQMGDDAEAMARDPALRAAHTRLAQSIGRLTGSPEDLAMPWPAWFEFDAAASVQSSLALAVPAAVLPDQLALYIDDARGGPSARGVSVSLEPIDRAKYGRAAQERDVALRVAHALAAGADRVDLPLPLRPALRDGVARFEPNPILPVERTLLRQLSNARFVGRAALADDVDGFCFERDGRGVMLVAPRGDAVTMAPSRRLTLTLGRDARRLELSGRADALPRPPTTGLTGVDDVVLDVTPMPFFVTDVDLPLVMLRTSLSLDRPTLESVARPHGRLLRFRNDFPGVISGSIRVAGPRGWTTSLASGTFNLNPGETFEAPLTITLPNNVAAGATRLTAEIRMEGGDDRRLVLPVPVRVGLADVGLRSFALRAGGGELVVQQIITNYGASPIDYTAFASVPGRPRQERLVAKLAPGKSVVRRYRFAMPEAGVKAIRSGLKELVGSRILNEEVPID